LTNVNLATLLTNYIPNTNQSVFTMDPTGVATIENRLLTLWSGILGNANVFSVKLNNVSVTNYYNTPNYLQLAPCSVFQLDYTIVLDPRLYPNITYIYSLFNTVNNSIYDPNVYNNVTVNTDFIPSLNNTVPLNLRFPNATREFFCFFFLTNQ
jgi:hypothetical protein